MAHILVVDDEINIRKVVREYAEFEGYEVTEAENGMEAVNLCHENDYDDYKFFLVGVLHHCSPDSSDLYTSHESTTSAAVSVRSILRPSVTGVTPLSFASAISLTSCCI